MWWIELIRRCCEVSVGKIDKLEVDFVVEDWNRLVYYQVAATVRDEKTLQREPAPLQKINGHYPKFILTLDDDFEADSPTKLANLLDSWQICLTVGKFVGIIVGERRQSCGNNRQRIVRQDNYWVAEQSSSRYRNAKVTFNINNIWIMILSSKCRQTAILPNCAR